MLNDSQCKYTCKNDIHIQSHTQAQKKMLWFYMCCNKATNMTIYIYTTTIAEKWLNFHIKWKIWLFFGNQCLWRGSRSQASSTTHAYYRILQSSSTYTHKYCWCLIPVHTKKILWLSRVLELQSLSFTKDTRSLTKYYFPK